MGAHSRVQWVQLLGRSSVNQRHSSCHLSSACPLSCAQVSILARLGLMGRLHSYASIGDHGKLVLPLRRALGLSGPAYIVHDVQVRGGEGREWGEAH